MTLVRPPSVQTVGIVSPGAMGSAVGAAYREAGNRVVTTVVGRSARTAGLAEQAELELVPDLDTVVGGVTVYAAPNSPLGTLR